MTVSETPHEPDEHVLLTESANREYQPNFTLMVRVTKSRLHDKEHAVVAYFVISEAMDELEVNRDTYRDLAALLHVGELRGIRRVLEDAQNPERDHSLAHSLRSLAGSLYQE